MNERRKTVFVCNASLIALSIALSNLGKPCVCVAAAHRMPSTSANLSAPISNSALPPFPLNIYFFYLACSRFDFFIFGTEVTFTSLLKI